MHIYIYDSYVSQKKHDKELTKIEIRITDLDLSGKIIRLGTINTLYATIENEVMKGAKTIIVIGDNNILNQAINAIAKLKIQDKYPDNIPLGFIPLGKKNNNISKILGIEDSLAACDVLSARRIKKLDLGLANAQHFLTEATISTEDTNIKIDSNYSIEIIKNGEIKIINIPTSNDLPENIIPSASDGVLELFIKTRSSKFINNNISNESLFSFKRLNIINPKKAVLIDDSVSIPTPVNISIAKEKIDMIVGKERIF
jgi:hypothetical protein